MKKLKGLNWKQFFVNHFEKVLFCLVIVGGLVAVATSRWAPYRAKDPGTLRTNVEEARAQHKVSTWPEDQQAEFADAEDISAKAETLLAALNVQDFAFPDSLTGIFSPVIDMQRPIGEIEWLPVEQMVADAGRVLILKTPEYDPSMMVAGEDSQGMPGGMLPPGMAGTAKPGQAGAGADEKPNPFAPRGAAGGMGMGMEGYGAGMPGMTGGAPGAGGSRGGGAAGGNARSGRGGAPAAGGSRGGGSPGGAGMMPEMAGMGMMMGMEGMYGGSAGVPQEGEGKRFVAVRGVFPLKQQEELLAEAMNLRTTAEATQRLQFIDYELERQVAQPGPEPWSGPWEDVDRSIAEDTIRESAGTEAVLYDTSIISPVFTMPLPQLGMGYWTDLPVSHPLLESETFSKTDLAKDQEAFLLAKIAEFKQQQDEFEQTQTRAKGWSGFTVSTQQIGQEMMSDQRFMNAAQGQFNQFNQAMSGSGALRGNARGGQIDLKTQIQQLITASGTYLLFRYLDFDVKPGYAYRYRVRVQVMNPAYGLEVPVVERADIAAEPTRWTDWSEPTPPSIVPKDTRHFLASIAPGSKREPTRARFEMFQWSEETGTMVNATVPVMPGSSIGGPEEATVIDPAALTIEPKSVDFQSGDVLVDIDTGLNTDTDQRRGGGENGTFEVPDRVLFVNDWGGLEVADKYGKKAERDEFAQAYQQFSETWREQLETDPAMGEEGMMYPEEGMEGMEGMMPEAGSGTGRGRGRGGPRGSR